MIGRNAQRLKSDHARRELSTPICRVRFRNVLRGAPGRPACGDMQRAVIVAVCAMAMMQVAIDKVVDVVPVRHRLVAAFRTVNVALIVSRTVVGWRAFVGIHRVHRNAVVLHVIPVEML